jgi:hypothetical protein
MFFLTIIEEFLNVSDKGVIQKVLFLVRAVFVFNYKTHVFESVSVFRRNCECGT